MNAPPFISKSLEDTSRFAEGVFKKLSEREDGATILSLDGDLGSGKTAFAKEIGALLGVRKEEITSPTFVIEKIYAISHPHFSHLIHIDAYRLDNSNELIHLGWKEITLDKKNLILIEWGSRVKEILPKSTRTIQFEFIDEDTRKFTFKESK